MKGRVKMTAVRITYPRTETVLQFRELSMEPGQVLVVAGTSGAGKSTLGHAAAGLLPFMGAQIEGRIMIGDEEFGLGDRKAWRRARGRLVRWIPQEPARAFTVTSHVLPQMLEGVADPVAARPQLERLLKALGLPTAEELDHRYPFEMSGGMLQRAAVISAFLTNPDLVVADEPTAYLDPPRTVLLARIVSALARSTKASVLWVTHDLRLAAAVADRLVLLADGQIEAEGDPAKLLNPFGEDPNPLVTASARMALPV